MRELLRRLHYLLHRDRFEEELVREMEFHREMAAREGGRPFGNTLRLREEARDAWGWSWIDGLSQDIRYAVRTLRRAPGFSAAVVLILGVGIGANLAVFTTFDRMALTPLPVRAPDSLLRFTRHAQGTFSDNFLYGAVAFYGAHSRALSAVLASQPVKLALEDDPTPLRGLFVTANYLDELGATTVLGRTLDPGRDAGHDAMPAVVLGHGAWQQRFGGDPAVLGRTIRLNGKPVTVIGVTSRSFVGLELEGSDAWLPLAAKPYVFEGSGPIASFSEGGARVRFWGRLQAGFAPRTAEAEVTGLTRELHRRHPEQIAEDERLTGERGAYATSLMGGQGGAVYPVLGMVGSLTLLVLAGACANLGGLLLARGAAREREIAVRRALGAGRGRLIRQLFTESLVLAALGAIAALGVGYGVLQGLLATTVSPAWFDPAPDWRVVLFAVGAAAASAVVFGLAPASSVVRRSHATTRSRRTFISSQVAASCILLIVAVLLARALDRAASSSPGFETERVVILDPALWSHGYTPAAARTFMDTLGERLRSHPSVEAVALTSHPPLGDRWTVVETKLSEREVGVHFSYVDPFFFEVMEIPLVRGRALQRGDVTAGVVSESLARLQWPTADPLGKMFPSIGNRKGFTVVGVAGNARLLSPEDSDAVEIYRLADESLMPSMVALVRAAGPPEALASHTAAAARAIDPRLSPDVQLLKDSFDDSLHVSAYAATSASLLAVVALAIACLGVWGLVAYSVTQRTREIGIRVALGARPPHVLALVLRQLCVPFTGGLLAGLAGAVALSQVLRRGLYGVSHLDPVAYVGAVGILVAAAALAGAWPARRALRVDPSRALACD